MTSNGNDLELDCSFVQDPPMVDIPKSQNRVRKSRAKVKGEWHDDDIIKLIKLIEERRPLWDKGTAEYKLSKDNLWKEIEEAFEEKFSLFECKAKWGNLRVTFNTNLAKFRSTKSGQGADEKHRIYWRFFKPMMFIESTDVRQSAKSTSSMDLVNADTDESILAELESANGSILPSNTPWVEPPRKRARRVHSPTSQCMSSSSPNFKSIAAQALVEMSRKTKKNKYEAFGEYISAELEGLPDYQAEYVKRKLNRAFLDLIDEAALLPIPPPPMPLPMEANVARATKTVPNDYEESIQQDLSKILNE